MSEEKYKELPDLQTSLDEDLPINESDTDVDSEELRGQITQARIDRYKDDTADRRKLAKWSTAIVSVWLGAVMLVVISQIVLAAIGLPILGPSVLIALLATTTLNVLGLSYIVLRGHFGNK